MTLDDKEFIDRRWHDRLPEGTGGYKSKISKLLEEGKPVKFNMGCGRDVFEGYLGVDMHSDTADIKQDILKLDLPENCADEIFASHVIEHIPQHRAPEVLYKWFQTLKPNGKVIMELPNLEELCKDFLEQEGQAQHLTAMCIFGAHVDRITPETKEKGALSPHLWGYTPTTLKNLVETVGFTNVVILPAQGQHPGRNFRLEAIKEAA